MNKIMYVKGDAVYPDKTYPEDKNPKIICHIVNDENRWGAGFVLALTKRWSYPEQFYRARQKYPLGYADVLKVEEDIYVANMIAQHRTHADRDGNPPIRYTAVIEALQVVNKVAEEMGATLHMPRIGCGLAGGEWSVIETILKQVVTVDGTVYDLK